MTPEREQLLDQNYALERSEWGAYAGPGDSSDHEAQHRLMEKVARENPGSDLWMWATLKSACIIGMGSDIGSELAKRLKKDGYEIWGTTRKDVDLAEFVDAEPKGRWDLLIFAAGTMEPIGPFFETNVDEWERCVRINALGPLRVLRSLWPARRSGSKVVFMSGPNPNVDTPTYSAYRAGKLLLASLVGTLNAEYPDTKFLWLIPGVVKTKIHEQTIKAGNKAANLERAARIAIGEEKTVSHDEVYTKLKILLGENPFPENEGA